MVSGHFRRIAQPQWGDPSPHLPRAPKPRSPAFASSRQLFQSAALVRLLSGLAQNTANQRGIPQIVTPVYFDVMLQRCVSCWNALCLACYTHHVGMGRRGLPKLWIRRESRLLDRVMGSRFPLDGLWHIIRRHQYFDLDTFGMKIEKCVSRGLYPKPPWLLLNIVVSCHAPHIVEFHLWAHFVVIFSRKFLDGRVEERADFLTPLSLPGMSRIENNWGCLAQIGEIATTFGIVALWPHTCTFQLKGVAEQRILQEVSQQETQAALDEKSEFCLLYAAHSCCCLCIASGIQNCIIHKSFQPLRASWGTHMSSNQNATAFIP